MTVRTMAGGVAALLLVLDVATQAQAQSKTLPAAQAPAKVTPAPVAPTKVTPAPQAPSKVLPTPVAPGKTLPAPQTPSKTVPGVAATPAKPLWDRLGGEPAVKAVVHDFVGVAAADPKVDFTRGGKYPIDAAGVARLETLLVELISATTGGPLKYEGRDMKSSHAGMKITSAQFGALADDLITVLKKYNVPQKEIDELVGIVASTKKDIVEE